MRALILSLLFLVFTTAESLAAQSQEHQNVGFIVPLSGAAASMGQAIERSARLAVLKNTTLVFEDDQCEPKKAISAYQKLVQKGIKVFYVACSGSILALDPYVKRDGNLVVSSYSGSAKVRDTGSEVIRFNPDAVSIAESMVDYLSKKNGSLAILYEEQDYAVSMFELLQTKLGDKIVSAEAYQPVQSSFKTQIVKLSRSDAKNLVFIPVSDVTARVILKEISELHFNKPIIGEVNLCDFPFKLSDFGVTGACFKALIDSPQFREFEDKFKMRYGEPSQYPFYDAMVFDIVEILDELAPKFDFASTPSITLLIQKVIAGVNGPINKYAFSPDGEVVGGEYLHLVEIGK